MICKNNNVENVLHDLPLSVSNDLRMGLQKIIKITFTGIKRLGFGEHVLNIALVELVSIGRFAILILEKSHGSKKQFIC